MAMLVAHGLTQTFSAITFIYALDQNIRFSLCNVHDYKQIQRRRRSWHGQIDPRRYRDGSARPSSWSSFNTDDGEDDHD
jgi:hypothetical protein